MKAFTGLYASGGSLSIIIEKLKDDFSKIPKWFHENFMVLNPNKCHFVVPRDPAKLYLQSYM